MSRSFEKVMLYRYGLKFFHTMLFAIFLSLIKTFSLRSMFLGFWALPGASASPKAISNAPTFWARFGRWGEIGSLLWEHILGRAPSRSVPYFRYMPYAIALFASEGIAGPLVAKT